MIYVVTNRDYTNNCFDLFNPEGVQLDNVLSEVRRLTGNNEVVICLDINKTKPTIECLTQLWVRTISETENKTIEKADFVIFDATFSKRNWMLFQIGLCIANNVPFAVLFDEHLNQLQYLTLKETQIEKNIYIGRVKDLLTKCQSVDESREFRTLIWQEDPMIFVLFGALYALGIDIEFVENDQRFNIIDKLDENK